MILLTTTIFCAYFLTHDDLGVLEIAELEKILHYSSLVLEPHLLHQGFLAMAKKISKGLALFPDHTIPVLLKRGPTVPRTVRLRPKPRKIEDKGIRQLSPRQRQALENFYAMQSDVEKKELSLRKQKREAAEAAGYSPSHAVTVMNHLLNRKPIIKELEKAGVTDERIADVIKEGLEAEHPLRPGAKDYHAVHKFVQEANRIKDNYPETRLRIDKESKAMVVHLTARNIEQFKKFQKMREDERRDPDTG